MAAMGAVLGAETRDAIDEAAGDARDAWVGDASEAFAGGRGTATGFACSKSVVMAAGDMMNTVMGVAETQLALTGFDGIVECSVSLRRAKMELSRVLLADSTREP